MKFVTPLIIGVLSLAVGSLRPAYGCREEQGPKPVTLPNCVGERATVILNRALSDSELVQPLHIDLIDDGHQTNFGLQGTRDCEGSMISRAGLRYRGTWSYTRVGDTLIKVKFSLHPSQQHETGSSARQTMNNTDP